MNTNELLASLPIEIWTECDDGQALLQLSRDGICKHIRINATLARFEPLYGQPPYVADYGKLIHSMNCPGEGACICGGWDSAHSSTTCAPSEIVEGSQ